MKRLHGEVIAVVLLLSLTIFISSYSQFLSTGKAISQGSALPDWAQSWAGVPWDVENGETLITSDFQNGKLTLDANAQWVWGTAWLWSPGENNGQGGWKAVEFPNQRGDGWVQGNAVAELPLSSDNVLNGENYVLAYTCNQKNDRWYCGCSTSQCEAVYNDDRSFNYEKSTGYEWQLQTFTAQKLDDSITQDMSKFISNPSSVPDFRQRASKIAVASEEIATEPRADFDGNGVIDFDDFFAFADAFGKKIWQVPNGRKYDLNNDDDINFDDFFIFAENFGKKKLNIEIKIATKKFDYTIGEKIELTETEEKQELKKEDYIPGQIILKLKSELPYAQNKASKVGISDIDELNSRFGVLDIKPLFDMVPQDKLTKPTIGDDFTKRIYKVTVPEETDIENAIEEYSKSGEVEYAEPNYLNKILSIPNDPGYNSQWGHKKISIEDAWNISVGKEDIIIAVIDTGVSYTHEDLKDNIWVNKGEDANNNGMFDKSDLNGIDDDKNGYIDDVIGWDFVDIFGNFPSSGEDYKDADNDPMDYVGHGTEVAGVAAATGGNGKGIAGVCYKCKIMPIRGGYMISGTNAFISSEYVTKGIKYATDNGAKIIVMSLGQYYKSYIEKEFIDYAYKKGVVLVAGAGNEKSSRKFYPAAFDNVIAVASTNKEDMRASFSNYGEWVDVAAPGEDIYTTTTPFRNVKKMEIDILSLGKKIQGDPIQGTSDYFLRDGPENITGDIIYAESEDFKYGAKGKYVLLKANSINLESLDNKARNIGILGVIYYGVSSISIPVDYKYSIPLVRIEFDDGELIKNMLSKGKVTINVIISSKKEYYTRVSGTSISTPYIAGIAGLILSKNPALGPREIAKIIKTTTDLPYQSYQYIGTGRVNAKKALDRNVFNVLFPEAKAEIIYPKDGEYFSDNFDIIGNISADSYILTISPFDLYDREFRTLVGQGSKAENVVIGKVDIKDIQTKYPLFRLNLDAKYKNFEFSDVAIVIYRPKSYILSKGVDVKGNLIIEMYVNDENKELLNENIEVVKDTYFSIASIFNKLDFSIKKPGSYVIQAYFDVSNLRFVSAYFFRVD